MNRTDLSTLLKEIREERSLAENRAREGFEGGLKIGGRAWRRRERAKRKAQKKLEDREYEQVLSRQKAQRRYYLKNKQRLNRARNLKTKVPQGAYAKAKWRAGRRGQQWEFKDFEEWFSLWEDAPNVYHPGKAFYVTAWAMRGRDYKINTQMYRRDPNGPWSKDNCFIGRNGKELEEVDQREIPE